MTKINHSQETLLTGLKQSRAKQECIREEFVLVLQDVSLEATRQRAEQVREEVKQLRVYQGGRVLDAITLSLGVAIAPDQGDTPGEVLQAADLALYRAKESGRDRTCVAGKD